jgi:hypothetical protein
MKALAAVIVSAVLGLFLWLGEAPDSAPVVRMISPFHDGHLWLCSPSGRWQPVHHPDCPCRDAIAP